MRRSATILAGVSLVLAATQLTPRTASAEDPAPAAPLSIQQTAEQRIGGADRYETAANVARWLPSDKGELAVVASGELFPDALSAAPLAALQSGRLLLTHSGELPDALRAELDRRRPTQIIIAGGPGAVTPAVEAELAKVAPVTRLGGTDRYGTAAEFATRILAKDVVIASGEVFADAVPGGALAAKLGGALLLTRAGELPEATAAALRTLSPTSVTVLGGPGAISDAVLAKIRSVSGATTTRVGGSDRYETAANIATRFFAGTNTAVLASGILFPDGLSGTPLAHAYGAPILLGMANCVSPHTQNALTKLAPAHRVYLGGASAVTSAPFLCGATTGRAAVNPPKETDLAGSVPKGTPGEEAYYFIPHQDDETISMVGGIIRDINAGRRVHVYLINAGYWTSVKDTMCTKEKICLSNDQITGSRNAEFLTAFERLGVPNSNVHFLYTIEESSTAGDEARAAVATVVDTAGVESHFRTMSWLDGHRSHYALGYGLKDACSRLPGADCVWFQSPLYQTRPEAMNYRPVVTPKGAVVAAPAWQVTNAVAPYKDYFPSIGRYAIGWHSVPDQLTWIDNHDYSWAHGTDWASSADEAAAARWIAQYQELPTSTLQRTASPLPFEDEFGQDVEPGSDPSTSAPVGQ